MQYLETLQAVDTLKALKALEVAAIPQGAYLYFPCTKCGKQAAIKAYGDKKNLVYCKHCKASGHIIRLVMELQGLDWECAKKYLMEKAVSHTTARITKPLTFEYEFKYTSFLEAKGLTKEFCESMEIGYPKGKTMLAGCTALSISDEDGKRIAYYGIKVKDGKHVFHKSFNPDLYLYGMNLIDTSREIHFTTDIWKCLEIMQNGGQAVYNFGLPYLSSRHIELLKKCHTVLYVKDQNFGEIMKQATQLNNYFKFVA